MSPSGASASGVGPDEGAGAGPAVIRAVSGVEAVLEALWAQEWDGLIVDFSTAGAEKLELVQKVRRQPSPLPVLALFWQTEDPFVQRSIQAGVSGIVSWQHAGEHLVGALERLFQGKRFVDPLFTSPLLAAKEGDEASQLHEQLSNREFQVFLLLAQGRKIAQIAGELSLSEWTIRTYQSRIRQKLGLETHTQLVVYALRQGLLAQQ